MGFDTAVMSILEQNVAGKALTEAYGARLMERTYHFSLKEEPGHGKRQHR